MARIMVCMAALAATVTAITSVTGHYAPRTRIPHSSLAAFSGGNPIPTPTCIKTDTPCPGGYGCAPLIYNYCDKCVTSTFKSCVGSKQDSPLQNCTQTEASQNPPMCGVYYLDEADPITGNCTCTTSSGGCGVERPVSVSSTGPSGSNNCMNGE